MNTLMRIPAVFEFEWRRTLTGARFLWMAALAFLPPLLLFVVRATAHGNPPAGAGAALIFVLCPCAACMLSVFLNATPAVASELEGRSWVYLAVRPYGPTAVLIGKYLVAISWAIPVGIVSTVLSSIAFRDVPTMKAIPTECMLVTLSCLSYAALFLFLGVILPKRAMVLGLAYTLVVEVALSTVPAVVNMLTIQYRLRCLLVEWANIKPTDQGLIEMFKMYFGDTTPSYHLTVICLTTVALLVASALILRYREFTSAMETDS